MPRVVSTAQDMRELGARLATVLRAGDLVLATGPLGAGKTTLTQGIAAGLGVTDLVTSPTFVLARRHRGAEVDLVHVDAYRLAGLAELDDLDLDSELAGAVTVVEWGEGLAEPLADGHLSVRLVPADPLDGPAGAEPRLVTLHGVGPAWAARQTAVDTQVSTGPGTVP
ncbi:MAG: tRNA (adenosine(37)-N6)-threonylcarbamoyltransferase complex ATPase subunit type 1 TsaE [Mycobacteriales bacterium]